MALGATPGLVTRMFLLKAWTLGIVGAIGPHKGKTHLLELTERSLTALEAAVAKHFTGIGLRVSSKPIMLNDASNKAGDCVRLAGARVADDCQWTRKQVIERRLDFSVLVAGLVADLQR